jgi:polysaccharide biosynthesis protein
LSAFYFVVIIAGTYWGRSNGAIYALLIYYLFFSVIGLLVVSKYNKSVHYLVKVEELTSQKACLKKIIIPVFLMSFVEAPLLWFAQAEIAKRGSYALVGGLSVILTIRYAIQVLPTYFYQAFTPIVTLLNMKGEYREYFNKFKKVSIALALVFVVLFVVLVLTGKFILGIFNEVYISYYQSYVISLFVLLFSLYSVLFKLHMMIREYQTVMFYMTILSSFFFLISFYAFLYFSFDMLNSFFYAQGLQYFIQLIVSVFVYNLDKKWNSV